jgi:hypothetical protein
MLFSPEMESLQGQMTAVIARDAEGYFDDPKDSEDLQTTVRIACEFYIFLQQFSDTPDPHEADYMAGTIRSGMDWFFPMAQTGRILTGLKLQTGFDSTLPRTFSELKVSYNTIFQQVMEATHSIKATGLLLSLVRMMFLFMTVYFPRYSSFSIENDTN